MSRFQFLLFKFVLLKYYALDSNGINVAYYCTKSLENLNYNITIVLALYSVQQVPKNMKQCRVNKRRFTICVSVNIFLSPVYKTRVYVTF